MESSIRTQRFGIRIVERVEFPIILIDRPGMQNLTDPGNFIKCKFPSSKFPSSTFPSSKFGVPTHGLGTSP